MANPPVSITPTAALARHLEWLEFALAAARDEESRRQGRLGRATDKNRDKRAVKLAEVSAEVRELAALVQGIRELQARAADAGASSKAAARAASKAPASAKAPAAAKAPAKGSPAASPKPRSSGTSRRASARQAAPPAKAESPRATSRRGRRRGAATGPEEPPS